MVSTKGSAVCAAANPASPQNTFGRQRHFQFAVGEAEGFAEDRLAVLCDEHRARELVAVDIGLHDGAGLVGERVFRGRGCGHAAGGAATGVAGGVAQAAIVSAIRAAKVALITCIVHPLGPSCYTCSARREPNATPPGSGAITSGIMIFFGV